MLVYAWHECATQCARNSQPVIARSASDEAIPNGPGGDWAYLPLGGAADLGGLHGVLLDQMRWLERFLSLKMVLRKPPRSLLVILPQVLYGPVEIASLRSQ